MAHFTYTAEKANGEVYSGVVEAADRFELYQIIRREGGKLQHLEVQGGKWRFLSAEFWNARFSTIPEQQKILFFRNLGSMLGAGLPVSRALSVMGRPVKNVRLRTIVEEIQSSVRHGDSLRQSL